MKRVNIYIACSSTAFRKQERTAGYVLEYTTPSGKVETRYKFWTGRRTYNQEFMTAIDMALEKMNYPCDICVYGENNFVLTVLQNRIKEWSENDFIMKGRPIMNMDLWKNIWDKAKNHKISVCVGENEQLDKMLEEMEKQT